MSRYFAATIVTGRNISVLYVLSLATAFSCRICCLLETISTGKNNGKIIVFLAHACFKLTKFSKILLKSAGRAVILPLVPFAQWTKYGQKEFWHTLNVWIGYQWKKRIKNFIWLRCLTINLIVVLINILSKRRELSSFAVILRFIADWSVCYWLCITYTICWVV